MGNCISNINKDHFFSFQKEMTNDILFFKGKTRSTIETCARGKKKTGVHSIRNIQKRWIHYKLERGGETFFKMG